jgi:hypothetical protein
MLALLGAASPARAAVPLGPPHGAVATNGYVTDMARLDDRVYLRGEFGRIGLYTGPGIALDPASGASDRSFAQLDGQISDVTDDGAGGWFVGGDFDEVANVAYAGLAHIRGDGTLDASFAPQVNGLVTSMARAGDRLFIGGFFDHVGGEFRQGVAAISTADGSVLPFDAKQTGRVTELTYAPATPSRSARVYVGAGEILALEPDTGRAVPGFSSDVHADIRALTVSDTRLYVGGDGLVALDASTGDRDSGFKATPHNLADDPAFAGTVHTLVLSDGRLLAGGDFNALGGASGPLVSLDPVTGRADRNFTPQVGTPAPTTDPDAGAPDRGVFDIARVGDALWVGGNFERAGGRNVSNLVAIDPATGALANATIPYLDGQVNALEPGSGRLYVGGQFFMAGSSPANGFAAISAKTGELDPRFFPPPVCCGELATSPGRVFLARQHAQGYNPFVKPTKRHPHPLYYGRPGKSSIVALDSATGQPVKDFATTSVRGLDATAVSDDAVYFAQRLDSRVRFPRNRILVVDPENGKLLRSFAVPLPGYVSNLAVIGKSLYAAGSFRRFRADGQPAHLAIVKLDPQDGSLDEAFDPHAHGPVYDLTTHPNNIWFAGLFDEVQGVKRRGLGAVYPQLGLLANTFAPSPHIKGDNVTNLTALRRDIVFQRYGTRLLGAFSGAVHRDSAGGYADLVDAATTASSGIAYAATIPVPLRGSSYYTLTFAALAPR